MKVVRGAPGPMWEGTKVFALMSSGVVLAALFYPFESHPLVTCPLRTWAHVPCPTCGMTRAFVRVTHGQLGSAFEVSPLGAALAVLAVTMAVYGLLRATVLRRGIELRFSPSESLVLRVTVVVAAAANWAYLILSGAAT